MADFIAVGSSGNWIREESYAVSYQQLDNAEFTGGLITSLDGATKLLWTVDEMAAYVDEDFDVTIPTVGLNDTYLEITGVTDVEGEGDRTIEITFEVKDVAKPDEALFLFWAKLPTGGYEIIGGRLYDDENPEEGAFIYIAGDHAAEFSGATFDITESTCNNGSYNEGVE